MFGQNDEPCTTKANVSKPFRKGCTYPRGMSLQAGKAAKSFRPARAAIAFTFLAFAHAAGVQAQTIQTYLKGNYLTAVNGGGLGDPSGGSPNPIDTNRTTVNSWETFNLVPIFGEVNTYAIQTVNGNYVTAVNGGGIGCPNNDTCPIHTDAVTPGPWEQFQFIPLPGAKFAIKTGNKMNYLTATNGGGIGGPNTMPIHTDATTISSWEKFKINLPPLLSFPYIEFTTYTGGDDLRSSSGALASITEIGPNMQYAVQTLSPTLNNGMSYGNDTTHTVVLALPNPVLGYGAQDISESIDAVRIALVQGSGISPDNWDLEGLTVKLLTGPTEATSEHIVCVLNLGYFGPGDHGENPAIARLKGAPGQTSVLLSAPDVTSAGPGCFTR